MNRFKMPFQFVCSCLMATLFLLVSCSDSDSDDADENQIEEVNPLIGTWKLSHVRNSILENGEWKVVFNDRFTEEEYSTFEFKEDGYVIEIDYTHDEIHEIEEVPYETEGDKLTLYWTNDETEYYQYSIVDDELSLIPFDEVGDDVEYATIYIKQ